MALRLPSRLSSASLPAAAMRSICPRFRAQLVSPPRRPARTCCERPGPWVGSASGVCVATFPTASRYGRCRGTVIAVMSKTQVWKRLRRSQPGVGEGRRYQGPGERPRAGSGRERASGRRPPARFRDGLLDRALDLIRWQIAVLGPGLLDEGDEALARCVCAAFHGTGAGAGWCHRTHLLSHRNGRGRSRHHPRGRRSGLPRGGRGVCSVLSGSEIGIGKCGRSCSQITMRARRPRCRGGVAGSRKFGTPPPRAGGPCA